MLRSMGGRMLRRRLRGTGMAGIAGAGRIRTYGRGLLGLGIPVAAALIRDLRHPDGYLRQLYNRIRGREQGIRVIEADYEQIDENRKKIVKPDVVQLDDKTGK